VPVAESPVLRLRSLLLFLAFDEKFPGLQNCAYVFPLGPCEPHESLLKKVIGPVLVMCAVDFADVLGAVVGVVEVQDFLGRDNVVKVAEDEEDGQVRVQFL
jgi:hypothetical protein